MKRGWDDAIAKWQCDYVWPFQCKAVREEEDCMTVKELRDAANIFCEDGMFNWLEHRWKETNTLLNCGHEWPCVPPPIDHEKHCNEMKELIKEDGELTQSCKFG